MHSFDRLIVLWSYWSTQTNLVYDALLVASCGYALARGGGPERGIATVCFAGAVATFFAVSHESVRFGIMESGVVIVDCLVLVGFVGISLAANRFWPLGVTAAHLVGMSGHLLKLVEPEVSRWGYAFAISFTSYPILILLVLGTWNHRRRLARLGADPPWIERHVSMQG